MTKYEVIEKHYVKNKTKLLNRYAKILGDASEDVLHDAYERALKYYDSFSGKPEDFENWFSLILKNAFKDFLKYEKMGSTVEIDEYDFQGAECSGLYDRMQEEINVLIEEKSEHHAEILRMYFRNQYSANDISKLSSLNYKNIHQIITRFRAELREKFEVRK